MWLGRWGQGWRVGGGRAWDVGAEFRELEGVGLVGDLGDWREQSLERLGGFWWLWRRGLGRQGAGL